MESFSGELKGIASLNENRRTKFGDKYKIENQFRFANYDLLLNSDEIDAVYISTPHTLHAELSIKAAGKGKHVLCEKPLTDNLRNCQNLIEKVKQTGLTCMVSQFMRFQPIYQRIKHGFCNFS